MGETPEKRENRSTCPPHASNAALQKTTAHLIKDHKRPFTAEKADRQGKQPESSLAGNSVIESEIKFRKHLFDFSKPFRLKQTLKKWLPF